MANTPALRPAQARFVQEYLLHPANAAEAARRAGYSNRRAKVTASELRKNPAVAKAISAEEHKLALKHGGDRALIIDNLTEIAIDQNAGTITRVRAIRELGLMMGLYPSQSR